MHDTRRAVCFSPIKSAIKPLAVVAMIYWVLSLIKMSLKIDLRLKHQVFQGGSFLIEQFDDFMRQLIFHEKEIGRCN